MADPVEAIKERCVPFSKRVTAIRAQEKPKVGAWYPYDTLGNIWHFDRILTGARRAIFSDLAGKTVADIGCADGELGLFLSTLGAEVDFIDHAPTNANHMEGVKLLRDRISPSANIYDWDLDMGFSPPREHYDLVLLLGILYHLKNPFYVLETLARHADTLLLSTRVAAYSAPLGNTSRTLLDGVPCAYLLDEREANGDPTNYWIFTEAGLKRLLKRAGWNVADFAIVGRNAQASDPFSADGDCRAFCVLHRR